jgi:hypothetical protein
MQTETFRLGIAFAVAALAVTAASLTVHWTARAQSAEDDNPRFTGVSTALDTDGLRQKLNGSLITQAGLLPLFLILKTQTQHVTLYSL